MARRNAVQVKEDFQSQQPHLHAVNNKLRIRIDDLKTIEPLTDNQRKFFELYRHSQILLLHGVAGTGKSYIALYKALEEALDKSNPFKKVVIVRSAVPSREIGHLPGDEKEKTEVYQQPYIQICEDLFERRDAFQRLLEQGAVQFMITSFIRGITLDDCVIIVDECQNMTDMELNSIITRVGSRSKIIFCGDFRQTDLYKKTDMSGLKKFIVIADMMSSVKTIEFDVDDIVRSALVKQYIIARMKYEEQYNN
jgi:phosphate starvation-inducible protein PhoH